MANIQKRGPSRYRVRYRDKGPERKEHSKTFTKKVDAEKFASTVEADLARGCWVAPERGRKTFDHYAKLWMTTLDCTAKTRESYTSLLNKWLLPSFGLYEVQQISWSSIEAFKAKMLNSDASPKTVTNALNVLTPILNHALRDGALVTNPAREVRKPRSRGESRATFKSASTISALADFIGGPHGSLVLFAGFSGLRAGECAGLQVADLDLMRGRVTVQRSVSEANGGLQFSLPKNGKVRTVPIPPFLRDHMVEHLQAQGIDSDMSAQVFNSPTGGVFRHSNFYKRVFRPAIKQFGIEGFRFHDLRHSYAAMLIAADGHPRAIMERMGHSSVQITLDTYGHLFPELDEALTDGLETAFQKAISINVRPKRGLSDLQRSA